MNRISEAEVFENKRDGMDASDKDEFSEAALDAALGAIDQELRQESDRIGGREIRGWAKFCKKYQTSMSMDDPLAERIFHWFERLYGDRLQLDLDFGKSIVVVRGDLSRMNVFRLYGTVYAVCTTALIGRPSHHATPDGAIIEIINLLEGSIDGMTPEFGCRLSSAECCAILASYRRMFVTFTGMEAALGAPYIKEAMDDLTMSAETLLLRKPNYGQSQWASLQATEKIVKSYILEKGSTHRKSHGLAALCADASALGMPSTDPVLIQAIQCTPDVRYDSTLATKDQAIAAHEAALIVCGQIAPLVKRENSASGARDVMVRVGGSVMPALQLWHTPPVPLFSI